jgi:hypothetical protein
MVDLIVSRLEMKSMLAMLLSHLLDRGGAKPMSVPPESAERGSAP